jgi:hypothetical protein
MATTVPYEKDPSAGSYDPEKSSYSAGEAPIADDRYKFDAADVDQVQRRLKQRHVQM